MLRRSKKLSLYFCNQIGLCVWLLVVVMTHFLNTVKKKSVFIVFPKTRIFRRDGWQISGEKKSTKTQNLVVNTFRIRVFKEN